MTGIRRVSQLGTTGESTYVDGSIQAVDIAANVITQDKLSTDIPLSGFRNVIINGDMRIAQRGTSTASITANGYYTCDRWYTELILAGTWTQNQSTDAPAGFGNSLRMQCTTAVSSPYPILARIGTRLEGQDLQRFAKGTASAKSFSLSFWVKAFQAGTYICELYDSDNTRQCSKSYTVNTSETWEYKTVTFPSDTTGAFNNDNGLSLIVYFWLGAGSQFSNGTLNTSWGAANYSNGSVAAGQINVASSTSNYFQITGVQLEANSQPTPFEQRPIGVELALCQRYCTRLPAQGNTAAYGIFGAGIGRTGASTIVDFQIPLPTTMRATPTSADVFNLRATDTGTGYTFSTFTLQSTESTPNCVSMSGGGGSGITGYRPYFITSNNNATGGYANFYAEL